MQKKMVIFIAAGVLGILLIVGLWLVYFSEDPEGEPVSEKVEETHAIDFTTRIEGVPEEEIDPAVPQEEIPAEPDVEDDPGEEFTDEVLKDGFVDSLAKMIFDNYFPAKAPGESDRFMLSFKMVNMHFATDLSDFRVDEQYILEARQEVMRHLLQPVVVDTVVRFYGPRLMDRIVYLAGNREKSIPTDQGSEERLFSKAETADLLRVFSRRLSYLSQVLERTAANSEVLDLINDYLRTVDKLREVYFEYWQLEDGSHDQKRDMLGSEIKALIERREDIREEVLSAVASADMRAAGHDYVYEVQWVYRRVRVDGFSKNSIQSLADAGKDLSLMALDRAEAVLEERTEDQGNR